MTWARFDDRYPDHPKIAGLSDALFRLHTSAICYCAEHMTDGFVSDAALRVLLAKLDPPKDDRPYDRRSVTPLVRCGLWCRLPHGYVVHDYLDYNPSKEKVLADRNSRSARGKRGADKRWSTSGGMATAMASAIDNVNAPVPSPTHSVTYQSSSGSSVRPNGPTTTLGISDRTVDGWLSFADADQIEEACRRTLAAGDVNQPARYAGKVLRTLVAEKWHAPQAAFSCPEHGRRAVTVQDGVEVCAICQGGN